MREHYPDMIIDAEIILIYLSPHEAAGVTHTLNAETKRTTFQQKRVRV